MKKIMSDKSFWIILGASIVSLIVLTVGVVFLTRKNTKEFYSAGYIISSTATKSDKYYFDDNTVYKENVFNEYVFTDVDNKEVSTSKDNFIHYLDNSLSFMKNGVILDLDNFNENIVPYYNITDKSIVQYNNGGYYIETADKTLVFGNFLGRITDNKYIVVGKDIKVKLAGNDESVSGDYFEILFVEDGIVKVENQEGSYQTISDGTIVYIGDDIKINLGDKAVVYGDEVKMSLTELTIDGNENIDIIPEGVVDGSGGGGSGSGDGDGTGTGDGDGTGTGEGDGTGSGGGGSGDGDGTGEGTGTGEGDGTDGEGETTTVLKKEVAVNLIEASSTINSISAKFQVIDTMEAIKGNLVLTVVNTTTGETVYTKLLVNTPEEQQVIINSLPSDCNYVMTIVDENNETSTQYFQKSFRTDSISLRLKREMVTETSLTYSLDFGNESDISSAEVALFDEDGNELGRHIIENGTDTNAIFEGLTNNTLYNVTVDNVKIGIVQYDNLYSTRTSDLTLKVKPTLGNISVKTNDETKNFTLKMDSVIDDDSAIVKYTYQIFKAEDITEETITTASPVYSFSRNELDDEILKLDETKNLYGNVDYRFKIVAQYYDNYRYNEIETKFSDYFQIIGKPTLSFEASAIDINRIAGTVVIEDGDCTLPFEGRECNNAPNNFMIRYYGGTTSTRNAVEKIIVDNENHTLSFDLNGLEENTLYTFEVYADIDLHNGNGLQSGQYIGGFNVSTTGIKALMMQNWEKNQYSYEKPISVNAEMVSTSPDDDSIDKLASLTFNLYSGDVKSYISYATPIATFTATEGIKDRFYNKKFTIDSSMFEYINSETDEVLSLANLDVLKELSGGKLSRYYTIEITDAFDDTHTNEFAIINNIYVYETPSILLLEDQVSAPEILVEEITNVQTKSGEYKDTYGITYNNLLDDEIIRGYKVTAVFDRNKIESYFATGNPITKINFYVNDAWGNLVDSKSVDFVATEQYTEYFFLGEGTDYGVRDKDLRRGNPYKFSYDLTIDDDGDPATSSLVFPANKPTSDKLTPIKQAPSFRLYVENSDATSITYKYQVFDYDNALYKEKLGNAVDDAQKYYIYYNVNKGETYTTEYVKDGSSDLFTLSNLSNGAVYDIGYYSATIKENKPAKVTIGNYFFDGYYSADNYNIGYELEYSNYDNRLKVIIEENEFLNRVSSYLITIEADGEKYEKVVSNLETCDERKCIVVDYKNIASFKGKNISVKLDAFYDTGYVGFGQNSLLGDYFKNKGYVDEANASKIGFVYQTLGVAAPGNYFYVTNNGYIVNSIDGMKFETPKGILGFELVSSDKMNAIWKLNTVNMIDVNNMNFVNYGDIAFNNSNVIVGQGTINIVYEKINFNPKVLDKLSLNSSDNTFSFSSITPKVSVKDINAKNGNSLINGAIFNINVSLDEYTMMDDFYATDGKYKFYVDIYEKTVCPEVEDVPEITEGEEGEETPEVEQCTPQMVLIKTVETDYENLSSVTVDGLEPNTVYYYKVAADMNKNGEKVKTPLFDMNSKNQYVEFEYSFRTLNAEEIFKDVTYGYTSNITVDTYSQRELTINSHLKNATNYDLRYQLYDIEGNLVFEKVIANTDIVFNDKKSVYNAIYLHDITGDSFVFGPGYYDLVITAITSDENKNELELYNNKLIDDALKEKSYHKLGNPKKISLSQVAGRNLVNDVYDYTITSTIQITDTDRVIDGKFYIELQDSSYNNICVGDNCKITVSVGKNADGQYVGICNKNDVENVDSCNVVIGNDPTNPNEKFDTYNVVITFKGLAPDTNYSTYVYANTYRKNYDAGKGELEEPEGFVYVRKNQYTKSALNFSLGAVTPVAASKNKLEISFVSSANLSNYLVGVKYTINIDGGDTVKSGIFGTYIDVDGNVVKSKDALTINTGSNDYPTISITTDKELGTNNYIIMEYYYKGDDGKIYKLEDAVGNTSFQYTVKNKS